MLGVFRNASLLIAASSSMLLAGDYGLPAGSKMPDFEAPAQNGNIVTLKNVLGPNGAVILFFRSADW